MTSVVAIIITLITYLWSAIPETFFEDRIEILSFDGNQMAVSNEGFGDVYLSHIFIESEDPLIDISMLRQIAKTLEVGKISRFKVKPYSVPKKTNSLEVVGNCSDRDWKEWLKRSEDKKDQCFYPAFYLRNGATMSILKSEQESLRTFRGHAMLEFYSTRSRKYFKKKFELSGVILRNKIKECGSHMK